MHLNTPLSMSPKRKVSSKCMKQPTFTLLVGGLTIIVKPKAYDGS